MAANDNDNLVIYGYSQGAVIANLEKRKLAEHTRWEPRPPISTSCWPVISICLATAACSPDSRAGTCRSSIGRSGSAPTDTQFDTVEINRQYDLRRFPAHHARAAADQLGRDLPQRLGATTPDFGAIISNSGTQLHQSRKW